MRERHDEGRVAVAAARGAPLVIEACEYDRLHAVLAYEFERITTQVRLVGAGVDGLGEDVSVFRGKRHRAARNPPGAASRRGMDAGGLLRPSRLARAVA